MTTYERRSLHETMSVLDTRTGGVAKLEVIIVKKAKFLHAWAIYHQTQPDHHTLHSIRPLSHSTVPFFTIWSKPWRRQLLKSNRNSGWLFVLSTTFQLLRRQTKSNTKRKWLQKGTSFLAFLGLDETACYDSLKWFMYTLNWMYWNVQILIPKKS